jgi:hypothetical protein
VLFAGRLLKLEELYFVALARTEIDELGAWNRSNDTREMIKRFITGTSKGLIEVGKGDMPYAEDPAFDYPFIP